MEGRQGEYLRLYAEGGCPSAALKESGVTALEVAGWTMCGSPVWDEDFALRYLGVQFGVKEVALDTAVAVLRDRTSRQRLAAAKFLHTSASREADRVRSELRESWRGEDRKDDGDAPLDFSKLAVVGGKRGG